MAQHTEFVTPSVVCYDITDPRRIQRMHRYLRRWGTPLQYSVFHCRLNDRERQSLISGLHEKINEKTDDVRLYAIQASGRILCLGQKPLPEEIQVYGLHQVFAGQFDQSGGGAHVPGASCPDRRPS